jgi:hypothetical protein
MANYLGRRTFSDAPRRSSGVAGAGDIADRYRSRVFDDRPPGELAPNGAVAPARIEIGLRNSVHTKAQEFLRLRIGGRTCA